MIHLVATAVLMASSAAAGETAPLLINVYHTNDVHGWIMSRPDLEKPGRLVGGAPALAAVIAKDGGPKLILDGGDWWQGTPEGSLSGGSAVAEIFNAVGYDAVVVGNHEYDAGPDALKALISKINAPVLSANTYDVRTGKRVRWLKPWIIKTVSGIRFGIFGLTTATIMKRSLPRHIKGLNFTREINEARKAVASLKKQGADVIIALTHVGFEEPTKPPFEGDQTIAREVTGIDLIVGGHSHTFLKKAYRDEKTGTLVVQSGHYLQSVGRTKLTIDPRTKKIIASSDELIELDPAQGEDAAVKALVDRRVAEVEKIFSVVVATAASTLLRDADAESALGDWVTDCYRERTAVEVALQNGGGIRADLPAGPVTPRSLFSVIPFDNSLVVMTLSGKALREMLDHGMGTLRIASISGAEVTARRKAPPGERLLSAAAAGSPIDAQRRYSVVSVDYLADGGDGYAVFSQAEGRRDTGELARDALRACAQRQKLILPPAQGRITLKD